MGHGTTHGFGWEQVVSVLLFARGGDGREKGEGEGGQVGALLGGRGEVQVDKQIDRFSDSLSDCALK